MWNEGNKSFIAAEDLAAYRRVKINSSGTVEYADADFAGHGVTLYPVKSGDPAAIKLFNFPGTVEIEAAGAIAVGAKAYAAADGKIQALPAGAGTYYQAGTVLSAATANGDVIEVLPDNTVASATVS